MKGHDNHDKPLNELKSMFTSGGGLIITNTSYDPNTGRPILQIIKTQDAHGHTEEKRVYGGKLLP
jgi:hypothetical protein